MIARIASTLFLWTAVVSALFFAHTFGWAMIVWALAAAASVEASLLCKKGNLAPSNATVQAACAASILGGWAASNYCKMQAGGTLIFTAVATVALLGVLKNPFDGVWKKTVLPTLLTMMAIPFAMQWLATLSIDAGLAFSVMILAAAKFCDVGAFVFGKGFGRHKLAPLISPNKTWEGAIGGIFSAATVATAISAGFTGFMPKGFSPLDGLWFGAVIGAAAIVSDLLESVFKRRIGVKDSGAIIPGIGGALDLADSVLLSAPLGAAIFYAFLAK